jgi:hypothetical protein
MPILRGFKRPASACRNGGEAAPMKNIRPSILLATLLACVPAFGAQQNLIEMHTDLDGLARFKAEVCSARFPAQARAYATGHAKWLEVNAANLAAIRRFQEASLTGEASKILAKGGDDPNGVAELQQLNNLPHVASYFHLTQLAKMRDAQAELWCRQHLLQGDGTTDRYLNDILLRWKARIGQPPGLEFHR